MILNPVNHVHPVQRIFLRGLAALREGHNPVDDDTNRYTSIGGNTITHDTAGNLTRDRQDYRYEYDYENRIARIYKLSGQSQITVASFDYDALGHRVRKIDAIAGQTTLYYNDPEWRVLAEYDAANNQLRKFIYGNYLDETLRMTDTYAGDSTPTGDYYFLQDHLYSPAVLLSSAGAVIERYEFGSYGTRHVFDQNFGTRANTNYGNYIAFQGHIHDRLDNGNLNLLDARYRTYDPFAGRWLMHEKLGMITDSGYNVQKSSVAYTKQYANGQNIYDFVLCNPVSVIDIYGLESIQLTGITLKRNHIKLFVVIGLKEGDGYGHWWTEIGADESYGWWPKYPVNHIGTIFGVEGELNGITSFQGTPRSDPHHGDPSDEMFHPWRAEVSLTVTHLKSGPLGIKGKRCCAASETDIKNCIRYFALEFDASHSTWAYPFGPNCHSFQVDLEALSLRAITSLLTLKMAIFVGIVIGP